MAILPLFAALLGAPSSAASRIVPESSTSRAVLTRLTPQMELDMAAKGLNLGSPVYLRIFKHEMELEVWVRTGDHFELYATLPICSIGGRGPGPKTSSGDGRAPEGFYFVSPLQFNPYSHFHLSFNVGYPNLYDQLHHRTGSAIMVHGQCCSIGCFAMTDTGVDTIWTLCAAALNAGQPFFRLHIFPFRMTEENMRRHLSSRWRPFWKNLKEGYDWFEAHGHRPPNVTVAGGRYRFSD